MGYSPQGCKELDTTERLHFQDTQACGKTTPKSKGIINTIVHTSDNAEKKVWECNGGEWKQAKGIHIIGKVLVLKLSDGFLLFLGFIT